MNLIKSSRSLISSVTKVIQLSLKDGQSETGSAGAIRQAGDAFGKLGAAKEAEYFHKQQAEQLRKLSRKDGTSNKSK